MGGWSRKFADLSLFISVAAAPSGDSELLEKRFLWEIGSNWAEKPVLWATATNRTLAASSATTVWSGKLPDGGRWLLRFCRVAAACCPLAVLYTPGDMKLVMAPSDRFFRAGPTIVSSWRPCSQAAGRFYASWEYPKAPHQVDHD